MRSDSPTQPLPPSHVGDFHHVAYSRSVLDRETERRPNPRIFDETDRWHEAVDAVQMSRIRFTVSQIPEGVRSVLDMGCGRGDIANRLPDDLFAAGCDQSLKGLQLVRVPKARGLVSQLPFASGSFDLVICAEVLEHLAAEDMVAALDEACRVSRRYVLLTVPYRENLSRMLTRCPDCDEVFHAYGHLRSFTDQSVMTIHSRLRMLSSKSLLRRERAIRPWIQEMRRRVFGIYETHPYMICPGCGNREFTQSRSSYLIRKLSGLLNRMSLPGSVQEGWIAALYVVEGPAS